MTVEDIKKCVNAYDAYTKKGKLVKMLRGAQWREAFTRYIELLTMRKTELDSAFTQQTLLLLQPYRQGQSQAFFAGTSVVDSITGSDRGFAPSLSSYEATITEISHTSEELEDTGIRVAAMIIVSVQV